MTKKTITLQTLLNLKDYLEKEIALNTSFVIANNAILKTKSSKAMKEKVRTQYDKRQECLKQLQIFKLAVMDANMKILEDVTNNKRIYERSDLVRDERFLTLLLGQKSKVRKGSKVDDYTFFIPKSELEDELQKIEARITELSEQLSEFNESFEVEVEVNKDLDLV